MINLSGYTIQLPTAGDTVHSLALSTSDTLVLSAGTFNATSGSTLTGGAIVNVSGGSLTGSATFTSSTLNLSSGSLGGPESFNGSTINFTGGTLGGAATLINSTLNDSTTAGGATITAEANSTIKGVIPSGQTITVQGNNTVGDSNLSLLPATGANGAINDGMIVVESASGSGSRSSLAVASGSTFLNAGTVQVGPSSAYSAITGSFDNTGTFTVLAGATAIVGSSGLTFTQDVGGTLTATGTFICNTGTLAIKGGTVSGNVDAQGCSIQLYNTISSATTVTANNGVTTLISNDSPLGKIQVQGNSTYGNATLSVASGTNNAGTILVESASGSGYSSNLSVASGLTFINAGTVQVGLSSANSAITGSFDNTGTFTVLAGATAIVGSSGLAFTQDVGGTLTATGTFICNTGTLAIKGGTVSGNVDAQGCSLQLYNTISSATTVTAIAGNGATTLISNDSPLGKIQVQGNSTYGNATLSVAGGANNDGTILVQSANGSGYSSNLSAASGSTFLNAGTVQVGPSSSNSAITGSFDNTGTFTVLAGATAIVGSSGLTFTQDVGGTLTATGTFICNTGTLAIKGGTVSGNVDAQGCSLQFFNTVTTGVTVTAIAGNGATTLISNDSPLGKIQVQGNNTYGNATLSIAGGANNDGTILLQSANGSGYSSYLSAASGSIFTNVGTVQVGPSSSSSAITGNFDNTGTLTVLAGATAVVGSSGLTFTQDLTGTLTATGTFICNAGTFAIKGGTVTGNVDAQGCSLQFFNTVTTAVTVTAINGNGATTLISNDSPLGEVLVQGNNTYGNATLSIAGGANNDGTILLQSANGSGYSSYLAVASGSIFTNAGLVQVGPSSLLQLRDRELRQHGHLQGPGRRDGGRGHRWLDVHAGPDRDAHRHRHLHLQRRHLRDQGGHGHRQR